jgi:hypothetical protein
MKKQKNRLKKIFKRKKESELYRQLCRSSRNNSSELLYGYVLYGVPCAGKSYILKKAQSVIPDLAYIDIDKSKYWLPHPPAEIKSTFYKWFDEWSNRSDQGCVELVDHINAAPEQKRYTQILMTRACFNRIPFISTCGNLPHTDSKFFKLLCDCFNVKISPVLISPLKEEYIKRVLQRGPEKIAMLDELTRQLEGSRERKLRFEQVIINDHDIDAFIGNLG